MSLKDYIYLSMPNVSHSLIFQNRFIINELNYNKETMTQVHASLLQLLTDDQLHIVVWRHHEVFSKVGGLFFFI